MNIQTKNSSTNYISHKALVPKSEYKGVILKLTPKDKEMISILQKKISELDIEKAAFEKLAAKYERSPYDCKFSSKAKDMSVLMNELVYRIENIKKARLAKQEKKLKKKLDING